jgi:uncharacterized protein YkwD
LALLAGLIWLAILVQHNIFRFTTAVSENTEATQQTPPRPQVSSPSKAPATRVSPEWAKATSTLLPPTLTMTATPTPPPVWHTVQQGEIPLSIPSEYGITVEALMRANEITDPTTLQIGQQLLIPITATPTPQTPATPSTPSTSPTPTLAPVSHTVQKGEILLSIAEEYDTTVEAIMLANEITNPRTLQVGQQLIIPPHKGSPLGVQTIIHEIKGGDTLIILAGKYGSTVEDIMATNPELEPSLLRVGQEIIIPLTQPWANPALDPTIPRITSPAESPPELVALAEEMVKAVNAERQAEEFPTLTPDEQLATVARAHAQDMVARGYFSHVTLEGQTLRDRLQEHGLELNWVGENIQRNTRPANEAAQYAVEWFMNSRPHRNNILHSHFDHLGVGVAEGPPGWYTFVLVFAGDS